MKRDVNHIIHNTSPWSPWNPTTGCTKVSPACKNCYAEQTALFLQRRSISAYSEGFTPRMHPSRLLIPSKLKKPKRIFVDAMSDLFHDAFDDGFIAEVFMAMVLAPQHTYFVLTKRPERMVALASIIPAIPNLCIGVTVESNTYAHRSNALRALPDHVIRFVNCEPLLANVTDLAFDAIDIVYASEEMGKFRRRPDPSWVINLEATCAQNSVPFFSQRFDTRDP